MKTSFLHSFFHRHKDTLPFIGLGYLVWFLIFIPLFQEFKITGDAGSYYDHTKFYIDNLLKGHYPLWNAAWNNGVPNEFFLRRIGNFNPAYFLIIFLRLFGFNQAQAYSTFLIFYWFTGLFGFYLLCHTLTKNRTASLSGFLLLLFSSLGTRLLDSFLHLMFTPMIWCFYFTFQFLRRPNRTNLLGCVFCFMILLTTYIPFYFLTIFFIILSLSAICYARQLPAIIGRIIQFLRNNKICTSLCAISLFGSFLPGIMMFLDTTKNLLVLPTRNVMEQTGSVLEVSKQTLGGGGTVEPFLINQSFSDLIHFNLEFLYIPIMAFVFLGCCLIARVNKINFILALSFTMIFLIGLNTATPIYPFLYEHVFFFKFFRNSLFLTWISLLPLLILLITEHLHQCLQHKMQKFRSISFAVCYHALILVFLLSLGPQIMTTFLSIGLSLLFCLIMILCSEKCHPAWLSGMILILIIIQPIEAYHHFKNNVSMPRYTGHFDNDKLTFKYRLNERAPQQNLSTNNLAGHQNAPKYYSTNWFHHYYTSLHPQLWSAYVNNKFYIADTWHPSRDMPGDTHALGQVLFHRRNTVFISNEDSENFPSQAPQSFDLDTASNVLILEENNRNFQMLGFSPNRVQLQTHYALPKLLVYNDSYHPEWKASINGHPAKIYRANGAFKGLDLPTGENNIILTFGSAQRRLVHTLNIILFNLMAVAFLWSIVRERESDKEL